VFDEVYDKGLCRGKETYLMYILCNCNGEDDAHVHLLKTAI